MPAYSTKNNLTSNIGSVYKVENGVTVPIGTAYKVKNGLTEEILSSGLPDNVLYDNGVEKNKLTGGFKFVPTYTWINSASTYRKWLDNQVTSGSTVYSTVTKNKLANSIQLGIYHAIQVYSPTSDRSKLYCSIVTNNKINLSGYTKVNINYTTDVWTNERTDKDYAYFDVYCNENTNDGANAQTMVIQTMGKEGNNLKESGTNTATIEIPSAALTKTCYLYITLRVTVKSSGSASNFKFRINKIWLE